MKNSIQVGTDTEETLPQLMLKSTTYKLIVPEAVEQKIRYLIRKYPHTEWSGILFYSHKGTFEDNDLVITCEDIYPMDLGNSVFTSFSITPDVAAYMADHPELIACDTGLCHSHHTLGAYFSDTDLGTLQKEGNDTNCFVSLIVDTAGTYVAAVTRKVNYTKNFIIEPIETSYKFFGEQQVKVKEGVSKKTVSGAVIEYFMLSVERHKVSNPFKDLDERFNAIEKSKRTESNVQKEPLAAHSIFDRPFGTPIEFPFDTLPKQKVSSVNPHWTPDLNIVHKYVCQLLTLNLGIDWKNMNLSYWIKRYMGEVYARAFGGDLSLFEDWASTMVEFFLSNYNDPYTKGIDYNVIWNGVGQCMLEELEPYTDNKYIKEYYDRLTELMN